MGEAASLTFPFFPHWSLVLDRCGWERSSGKKGKRAQVPGEHTQLSPSTTVSLQRDSVTLRLIHM